MRIAQVATLFEPVPPARYGGVERVVGILTDQLVAQGHDVTLFASGDSTTKAQLVPACPQSLRLADTGPFRDFTVAIYMKMMMDLLHRVDDFDVMHFHTGFYHLPTFYPHRHRSLTTVHMPMSLGPDIGTLLDAFAEMPYIGISHDQRSHRPSMNWRGVVHHGIPADLYRQDDGDGGYLLFVGRIAPSKRPDRAIEIARGAGLPLKIAAKVDDIFRDYFDAEVAPHIDGHAVEFLGEVSDQEKQELYGGARALLFPIDWNEPFGLVLIEAMACGTPVVAWDMGSVTEIVDDGVTGFRVTDIDAAVEAVRATAGLDRGLVRATFDRRFTAERMTSGYVAQYERMIDEAEAGAR
ncbi:glycosyltransferase family 4 protein [Dactylosporangium sp. NPDC005555]|uniref:glycosyltransferase family 4 protein n=1 Tax=Dactylosporangium sp. NPDC005555 TaxID=3154889 RepID=UPI0033B7AD14